MPRQRLTKLRLDEVSLVDVPANAQAEILIAKRRDGNGGHSPNSNTEEHGMTVEELSKKLEEMEAQVADLTKRADKAEADKKKAEDDLAAMQKRAEDAEAEVAKAKAGDGDGDGGDDHILKGLDPAVRKYIEDLRADGDESREAIAKMADEKLTDEYVAKAGAFTNLPGIVAKDFGPVLKRVLFTADEADRNAILDVLAKADAAIEKALTTPLGQTDPVEKSDAESQLETKAHEIAKRDGVTFAKAYQQAMHDNPELYQEYLNSKKS